MKYIAWAIALSVIILTLWFVLITPPCNGNYDVSLGGDKYFLFSCKNADITNFEPDTKAQLAEAELDQPLANTTNNELTPCTGDIQIVFTNFIGEVNKWISIQGELRLHILALSLTEADLSVRTNTGDVIKTFTMRAGRTEIIKYQNAEYRLLLNHIEDPMFNDIRVNVTLHKITCT
ncbi:hypothetical protein [Paraglaciecola aestuariivivens]